jgi:hypothetical protein
VVVEEDDHVVKDISEADVKMLAAPSIEDREDKLDQINREIVLVTAEGVHGLCSATLPKAQLFPRVAKNGVSRATNVAVALTKLAVAGFAARCVLRSVGATNGRGLGWLGLGAVALLSGAWWQALFPAQAYVWRRRFGAGYHFRDPFVTAFESTSVLVDRLAGETHVSPPVLNAVRALVRDVQAQLAPPTLPELLARAAAVAAAVTRNTTRTATPTLLLSISRSIDITLLARLARVNDHEDAHCRALNLTVRSAYRSVFDRFAYSGLGWQLGGGSEAVALSPQNFPGALWV